MTNKSKGTCLPVAPGDNTIIDYTLLLNVTTGDLVVGEHSDITGPLSEDHNLHVMYCGDYPIV